MFWFEKMLDNVRASDEFDSNARLLQYVGNTIKSKLAPNRAEAKYLIDFAVGEMKRILALIPAADGYRKKDALFFYEDAVLMVFTLAARDKNMITDGMIETVRELVGAVAAERTLEGAIDDMFERGAVTEDDINRLIDIVRPIEDEYRRGMVYKGLQAYEQKIGIFTDGARAAFAEFAAEDGRRLLAKPQLTVDEKEVLEFYADAVKHFFTDGIADVLQRIMLTDINAARYFALETLLENGRPVPERAVVELAHDLGYAELTYGLLSKHKKLALFPEELDSAEYLAKSDLVHWLMYPTELNMPPDEIEYLGCAKVRGDDFYVFKYRSDSDMLSDDVRGKWLIGWANPDGGTFSNFDVLEKYVKKTDQKTAEHIGKKLIAKFMKLHG